MTEITAEVALRSKQNFTEYIQEHSNEVIKDLLSNYPYRLINVVYPQLTASSEGLIEAVNKLNFNDKAYIFWFIAINFYPSTAYAVPLPLGKGGNARF